MSVRNSALINITGGENITAPAWIRLDSGDGKWYKADGRYYDEYASALLLSNIVTDGSGQAYFAGEADWPGGGLTPGVPYYLSVVAPGDMMTNAVWPFQQFLGYAPTADTFLISPANFVAPVPDGGNEDQVLTKNTSDDYDYQWKNLLPYTVYSALISQSGTSAPTATVLKNTLSGTVTWSRSSAGVFLATKTGEFSSTKTTVSTPLASRISNDAIQLNFEDSALSGFFIEIRVYP